MRFRKYRGNGQEESNNGEGSLPFSTWLMAMMAQLIISLGQWSHIEEKNNRCREKPLFKVCWVRFRKGFYGSEWLW